VKEGYFYKWAFMVAQAFDGNPYKSRQFQLNVSLVIITNISRLAAINNPIP